MEIETLTNRSILEQLRLILGHDTNSSLARDLDVSKQSLHQFSKQPGVDINNKMLTVLIEHIKKTK